MPVRQSPPGPERARDLPPGPSDPWSARDRGAALLLSIAFALLYGATWQPELQDDGPRLVTLVHRGANYYHPLYAWLGAGLDGLLPGNAYDALRVLAVGCGGALVGATYLFARLVGSRPTTSLLVAGLAAVSPASWNAGTTVELHGLHATIATAVTILVFLLPRSNDGGRVRRFALLGSLTGGAMLLLTSHWSGVTLLPGLLVGIVTLGEISPRRRLLAVLALLAGVALAVPIGNWMRFGEPSWGTTVGGSVSSYLTWDRLSPWEVAVREWFVPNRYAMILAALGAFAVRGRVGLTLLVLLLARFAAFLWYGFEQRGGFSLASVPVLAVLVAAFVERVRLPLGRSGGASWIGGVVVSGFLVLQAVESPGVVRSGERGWPVADRVERLRDAAGGRRAWVLSAQSRAPVVDVFCDEIVEIELRPLAARAWSLDQAPPAFDAEYRAPVVDAARAEGVELLIVDLSYRHARSGDEWARSHVDALVDGLSIEGRTRKLRDEAWPLLVVELEGGDLAGLNE